MQSDIRLRYLAVMGIQAWAIRTGPLSPAVSSAADAELADSRADPEELPASRTTETLELGWEALQAKVAECVACGQLVDNRTQTVFGVGNREAEWLIIGEAPGADEDRRGEPFVGRAGQLLNAMLVAVGLGREAVYIANIIKCRPPKNRDPSPEEAARCEPYLLRQISLVNPKVILALGRVAAHNLLKTEASLAKLRGRVHSHRFEQADRDIPIVVTYHPAYLLRSPLDKRKTWEDLQLAVRVAQGTQDSSLVEASR
jgi:uracil-DNA glycosylase family 4